MDQNSSIDTTPAKTNKPAAKKVSPVIGLFISFFTLALCLGGLELIAYRWEIKTAQGHLGWTLVAARRLSMERHGTSASPYYLMKPGRSYNWEGIPVTINARGLRGPDFTIPKPTGTTRILNLGDSIAFGWEVPYEDTYGVKLAHLLQDSGWDIEVINAGVPAWNLESERNFLQQEGLAYQPDLVILDITLVNDIYGAGPSISEKQTVTQWLRDHTYFWPFLTIQARFLLSRQRGPEAIPVLNPPTEAEAYFPTRPESPVWDEFWAEIDKMATACQAQDVPFIIIVFPTAFQLNSANHSRVPQEVLAEHAANAGLPLIDLLPVYEQVCAQAERGACEGYENLLFADVWMHPNTLGHRLAAETLLPEVHAALDRLP
jgi:lysophospholipase L1-like esterase